MYAFFSLAGLKSFSIDARDDQTLYRNRIQRVIVIEASNTIESPIENVELKERPLQNYRMKKNRRIYRNRAGNQTRNIDTLSQLFRFVESDIRELFFTRLSSSELSLFPV